MDTNGDSEEAALSTVLIVDDSSTARMFAMRCLQIAGLQQATFLEAVHGKDALVLLKEEAVDLVVSDLIMPEMDGYDLLKSIKASPRLQDIPVLIISSANNTTTEKELVSMGAFAVMSKPISPAMLADTLQTLANK